MKHIIAIGIFVSILGTFISIYAVKGTTDLILSDEAPSESNDEPVVNSVENMEQFIPTNEWQQIKENQAIPAGLHIRMNFQTGIKEAKLMDDDENEKTEKGPKIVISKENKNLNDFPKSDEKLYFTKQHLKDALSEFKDKIGKNDVVNDVTWSEDAKEALKDSSHDETVRKKFRTLVEIRTELNETMGVKITSDLQIMKDHVKHLLDDTISFEEKVSALDNLEYYVHQLDNARDLDRVGGIEQIVLLLNGSNEILQEKAANVLGAASQSNGVVQNSVMLYGGMPFLLKMLSVKKLILTRKKALYALSALVRGNSKAQTKLVKLNGLQNILKIVKDNNAGSLQVKAVTLLFDLIVEQNEAMEELIQAGKKKKNERSPLFALLLENSWCDLLPQLLQTTDYDTKEKVMQAIIISVDACIQNFKDKNVMSILQNTLNILDKDIKEEDDKDFQSYLEGLRTQLKNDILRKLS